MRVFISYRRDDSSGYAGRIYDHMTTYFGEHHIFMDIDTIAPGQDFVRAIEEAVGQCDAFLTIIGKHWLTATDESGSRRLDDPRDFVRLEISQALSRAIPVIPVLVDAARMPPLDEMPAALQPLTRLNAFAVSHERFRQDIEDLIKAIEAAEARRLFAKGQGQVDVAGLWKSPNEEIEVYFRQKDNKVVGVFRLGGIKMGIYIGELLGYVLEFKWRWFDARMHGNGRMIMAGNLTKLSGHYWIEDNEGAPSDLQLSLMSNDVPAWVADSDFDEFETSG